MDVFENLKWLLISWDSVLITIFSTILIYTAVIVLTRINGLRTFAKMSSFDFAITIAIGSLIASTMLLEEQSVAKGVLALIVLLLLQAIIAHMRRKSDKLEQIITNTPVLLMEGKKVLYENLEATRVSEADLFAKLRAANVSHFDQVLVVVLETTGDISVLHTGEPSNKVSEEVLKNVAYTAGKSNLPKSERSID
ncbi:DUF421 domain-containing protein [Cryomorpha ignava]|uniref:DUF421 domain-containing protein n=1 Tax=Cryomorpha ignava TaxID=101383 RepID=A0A7K3WRB2_9FLAO|nr:YetF domain-containing protein [Cryomorpha ignava]NEN24219.1 DUF421 domain-containing protein [Cryomorpha ignava]